MVKQIYDDIIHKASLDHKCYNVKKNCLANNHTISAFLPEKCAYLNF